MAEDEEGTEGTDGPAGLRKHARQLEKDLAEVRAQQERDATELQTFRRERAFGAALAEANVEGVTLDDVGDLPADQITSSLVRAKAAEKEDQRRAAEERQAKELGFESLDEYRDVLKIAQERKAEMVAQRQTAGSVATSAPGREPEKDSPGVIAYREWEDARKAGVPADHAAARFVGAKARAVLDASGQTGGPT